MSNVQLWSPPHCDIVRIFLSMWLDGASSPATGGNASAGAAGKSMDENSWKFIWLVVWNINFTFPYIGNLQLMNSMCTCLSGQYIATSVVATWLSERALFAWTCHVGCCRIFAILGKHSACCALWRLLSSYIFFSIFGNKAAISLGVPNIAPCYLCYRISSSQLTNSYFSEGWPNHQPVKIYIVL